MGEPSKEAWRVLAEALQRHMDATIDAREWAAHLNGRAQVNLERAEAAEARVKELEASKAKLIREVREWAFGDEYADPHYSELNAILAKHEGAR